MRNLPIGLVLGCLLVALAGRTESQTESQKVSNASLDKLPLYFVENQGVYPDEVRFYVQGADKTLFFTDHGVTVALEGKERGWTVKLDFVGADRKVRPVGLQRQKAIFSYFQGPQEDWKAGLPSFSRIVYRDLWPGIDLVYNGTVNQLKYEFVVAPGVDPNRIRLQYRGATSVSTTDAGALRVETPEGSFEDAPPVAWQEIDGRRVSVAMAYAVAENGAFRFTVGEYDSTYPLILDPAVIVYCGYIGGTGEDQARFAAVDNNGCLIVAGHTDSPTAFFPVKTGPFTSLSGSKDAFVAKVDPAGLSLVYCGYIGGTAHEWGRGVAVDATGNAYVAGATLSDEKSFPVVGGPGLTYSGNRDAFVAKVDPTGRTLLYCGYIGGVSDDDAWGIAADPAGNTYLTGRTSSDERSFPALVGPDLTYNGGSVYGDAFVAKISSRGQIVYCGYIGGSDGDWAYDAAVDPTGAAYVAGHTLSDESSFPVKVGPDLTFGGPSPGRDAFVAKVNPQGTALDYCGYIGGASTDMALGVAADQAGCAYVVGQTTSNEKTFPVKVGPGLTFKGTDAFIAKVDASGRNLVYCGYVAGAVLDTGQAVAVDPAGFAILVGNTESNETNFPVKVGPDLTHNGGKDGFIARVDPTGARLTHCGYIGGATNDIPHSVAVDASGNAYVTGYTDSDKKSFPVLAGPDVTYNGGKSDAFVVKIAFQDTIAASGVPRPGATVTLDLTATDAPGLHYQFGSSLGAGPILVGKLLLGLARDDLLTVSVFGLWPHVFRDYTGTLDAAGKARATIAIPQYTVLIGARIHTAAVTLDPARPSGIRSVSQTNSFTIVK